MSGQAMLAGRGGARRFYVGMAAAITLTVFVGFAPTFYLKPMFGNPPLSALVWVHGLVFSAWIAVLLAQTMLVAAGRTDLHRRLGIGGAVLALAMPLIGLPTAITAARLGHVPPGAPPPLMFLAIPFFAIVLFVLFAWTGLALRARAPQAHKRLMLLATASILGAAIARLPFAAAGIPPVFFAIADMFIVAGMVHDWRAEGRVHPAYLWGGLLLLASQPFQLAFMGSAAWLAFAGWMTGSCLAPDQAAQARRQRRPGQHRTQRIAPHPVAGAAQQHHVRLHPGIDPPRRLRRERPAEGDDAAQRPQVQPLAALEGKAVQPGRGNGEDGGTQLHRGLQHGAGRARVAVQRDAEFAGRLPGPGLRVGHQQHVVGAGIEEQQHVGEMPAGGLRQVRPAREVAHCRARGHGVCGGPFQQPGPVGDIGGAGGAQGVQEGPGIAGDKPFPGRREQDGGGVHRPMMAAAPRPGKTLLRRGHADPPGGP